MTSDEEKAYEDALDGSGWQVPPKPDATVIAELRAEVGRLRAALENIARASPVRAASLAIDALSGGAS